MIVVGCIGTSRRNRINLPAAARRRLCASLLAVVLAFVWLPVVFHTRTVDIDRLPVASSRGCKAAAFGRRRPDAHGLLQAGPLSLLHEPPVPNRRHTDERLPLRTLSTRPDRLRIFPTTSDAAGVDSRPRRRPGRRRHGRPHRHASASTDRVHSFAPATALLSNAQPSHCCRFFTGEYNHAMFAHSHDGTLVRLHVD